MDPSPQPPLSPREQSPILRENSRSPQNDGPSTSYESGQASPASFHVASPTSQTGNSPGPRRPSISPLRRQRSRSPPSRYRQRSSSPSSYRGRGRGSRGRGRGRGRGGYRDEWAPSYRRDDDRPRGSFRGRGDVYLGRRSRSPPRRRSPSPVPRSSRYSPPRYRSPPPRRRDYSPRRSSPPRHYNPPPRRFDDPAPPRRYTSSPRRYGSSPKRHLSPRYSRHSSPNRDLPPRSPVGESPRRPEPDRRSPRRSPDPGDLRASRIRGSPPTERRKFPPEINTRHGSPPRSPRSRSPSPNRRRSMLPPRRDPLYPLYDDRRARGGRGRPRGRGRGIPFDYDRDRPFRGRGRGFFRDDSRRSDEDRTRDEKSSADTPMDIDSKPEPTVVDTTMHDNLEEGETNEVSMQVDAPVSSLDDTSETAPPPRASSPPRAPRALLPAKPVQAAEPPERLRHAASISDRERQKLPDRPAGERGLPDRPRSDVEWSSNTSGNSPHYTSTTHRPKETDENVGKRDIDRTSPLPSPAARQSPPDTNLREQAREASSSKPLPLAVSIPSISAVSDSTPVGTPRIDQSIMRFPTPASSTTPRFDTPRLPSAPIPSGPRLSSTRGRGGAPNALRLPYIHKYATNPRVKGTLHTINQTLKAIADLREQRRVLKAHLEGGVSVVNACVRVEDAPNSSTTKSTPVPIWQERVVWNGPRDDGPLTVFGAVDKEKAEVNAFLTSLPVTKLSKQEGLTRDKIRADWEAELSLIELKAAEQRRSVAARLMDKARLGRIGIDYNEGDAA